MSDVPASDASTMGGGQLDVRVVDDGWQVVAHVIGEADVAAVGRLQEALVLYLVPGQRVVLDLSGVTFMDTTCLGVLEHAHSALAASGGALVLRNPSRTAQRLLSASEADKHLVIETG